jgi:hypothetical protein
MGTNKITTITRRHIADALTSGNASYAGRMLEADFLSRLFDLTAMPSNDYRPEYDNAYKDIRQHADNNPGDWQPDWVFTDVRLNLMHCTDEVYLGFLNETLSPHVRTESDEQYRLVEMYNKYLVHDGFQFDKVDEISGRPIFKWAIANNSQEQLTAKAVAIKKYLNTDYVSKKIDQMNKAIQTDTDIAIGTGKELLETICKSILKQKGISVDKEWSLPQLIKNTTNSLDFKPKEADDPDAAERSIKQILGGIQTIVHGVSELRNAYGSGHGKDADFRGLESKYAKLFVGVVSEIAIIYLATNGETELVDL